MFVTAIHFHPRLIFVAKAEAYQSGPSLGIQSNVGLQVVPINIRLDWNCIAVANTLAYYNTVTITAIKGFILKALELQHDLRRRCGFMHRNRTVQTLLKEIFPRIKLIPS